MLSLHRLVTIPISHYCEKARWALDRAGLDYAEERHVQGVHILAARRAGGGETVPVLVAPAGVYASSEAIVRYADERLPPEQRLFGAEDDERAEAERLSRWLDEGLGPDARRLMYAHMLQLKGQMLAVNNQGVPAWEGRALRALWPAARRLAGRKLGVGQTTIAEDAPRVWQAFDVIGAQLADGRPHLCGERFTAADLTFACLAAAVVVPPEYGVRLPQPEELPARLAGDIRAFREHPAGAYALRLFRTLRRAPAGVSPPDPAAS
jgi:glutathione S-transferase